MNEDKDRRKGNPISEEAKRKLDSIDLNVQRIINSLNKRGDGDKK